ncbi:hypothetical protein DF286_11910 [Sphingosinicella humi]|uniref:Uncharacterized protein n=2 Tax=Allosphingosinicella humi TaxID=2068657 RepID=A0A2U2J6T0_9SPHN|nr:hypothetical protein DF286_11910 [Sphingosinicella humi]
MDSDVYSDKKFLKQQRAGEAHMNMCATRISLAFHDAGAGALFDNWRDYIVRDKRGRKLIASVEHLMELLEKRLGRPTVLQPKDARNYAKSPLLAGQQGLIAFRNFWQRRGETAFNGDHMDLWRGDEISGSALQNLGRAEISFWPIWMLGQYIRSRR